MNIKSLHELAVALASFVFLPKGWIRTKHRSRWWDAKYIAVMRVRK